MKTKHLLFTFLACVLFVVAKGQKYHSLPNSDATWIIAETGFPSEQIYSRLFLSSYLDDTLINSKFYNKVYYQYNQDTMAEYCGAFRNETDAVSYFVPPASEQEYVLRDFTKNIGDTIRDVIYHHDVDWFIVLDFVVDTVEYKQQGPYTTKVMYLSTVVPDTISPYHIDGRPMTWMQGVGSIGLGILNSYVLNPSLRSLDCMQHNDTIFCQGGDQNLVYTQGKCSYPLGIEEKANIVSRVQLQPNPFYNQIVLSRLPVHSPLTIKLINIYGQTVFTKVLHESPAEYTLHIDPNLPKGMYLMSITAHDKIISTVKIEKE